MKNRGFTLLEILIAIIGFALLMVIIVGIYQRFILLKYNFQARGNLIENSYFAMEKINLLLKDYTIDYEEYFNRQNVGCNDGLPFSRNISTGGYCSDFTAYGNGNGSEPYKFSLYYCSSIGSESSPQSVFHSSDLTSGSGCAQSGFQSFGQYQNQFIDVGQDVDTITGVVGDDDDINLGIGPDSILFSTGVKELYLISQDRTRRVFLRRALVDSGDFNGDGAISGDTEYLYTLQILKLRGFDAGDGHDFDPISSSGVYDGVIDTWACDYAQGFICSGAEIGGAYSGFRLPIDGDDGRVNIFDRNLTISDLNFKVFPTQDPQLARGEDNMQINPYFTVSMTSKLYGGTWFNRLKMPSIESFQFTLQTTFSTKTWYTR